MRSENLEDGPLNFTPVVTGQHGAVRERHTLFDDKIRDYAGPALRAESGYSFYDRSSLKGYELVRQMLQRWVDRMPPEKQTDIVSRMRHKGRGSHRENQSFNGAFFELFLHEFLNGTGGHTIVEPKIGTLTPDFGVAETWQDGTEIEYVVEASDIDIYHGTDFESDWNELQALDILDEIEAPQYRLYVETEGRLTVTLSKRGLKAPFEQLVRSASYEDVLATETRHWRDDTTHKAEFRHGDWSITGNLVPVPEERQPRRGRFIGMGPAKSGGFNDIEKTKERLYEKAKRYKEIDNLIIALRSDSYEDSLAQALFGRFAYRVYVHKDPADTSPLPLPHSTQVPDGFWFNTEGLLNQNVIGVVEFHALHPYHIGGAKAVFYANPYTERPLPAWTKAITHAEYRDGKVEIVEGVPPYHFMEDYQTFDETNFQFQFE